MAVGTTIPINKNSNSSETSDWECNNCGATLANVNNNEVQTGPTKAAYRCICSGIFVATRNEPKYKVSGGQKKNLGGGRSFPGG